jgi:hypothetical protein
MENERRQHVQMTSDEMSPAAKRAARKMVWALIVLFVAGMLVSGLNLLFTASQVNGVAQRTKAACAFWRDIAAVPLVNIPGKPYPSEFSVTVVAHSRQAFRGFGCPGGLPAPSSSFVDGARIYHLDPR